MSNNQYRGQSSGNQPGNQQRTQQQNRSQQQGSMPPPAGAGNQAPAIFTPSKQKLFQAFADRFGVDADVLVETMKKTCFRGQRADSPPVTNEQLVALLIVADQYKLNPFTKEIYAYPDKGGGIVPVVSIDGWIRIIQEHPQYDGMTTTHPDVFIVDETEIADKFRHRPCWEWYEVTITRKDRKVQTPVREYFDEIYRSATYVKQGNDGYYVAGPWQTHTKRMTRHKTIIQAGRITFGFAGIYDDDEALRILSDDRVVSTVPQGEATRAATHTDAAKEALRQRTQSSASAKASTPEEGARKAQQQANELGRQAGTPPKADDTREYRSSQQVIKDQNRGNPTDDAPWEGDEPPKQPQWPPVTEKESWISLVLMSNSVDALQTVWAAFVDASERAGLEELDLDVESNYQFRLENLQQK